MYPAKNNAKQNEEPVCSSVSVADGAMRTRRPWLESRATRSSSDTTAAVGSIPFGPGPLGSGRVRPDPTRFDKPGGTCAFVGRHGAKTRLNASDAISVPRGRWHQRRFSDRRRIAGLIGNSYFNFSERKCRPWTARKPNKAGRGRSSTTIGGAVSPVQIHRVNK
ncbi:Hypothetical protein CINCED_3A019607 [Cinara cedri]|uniref:Uncharacterized protein n=1 Tax=Cinara cedri TaxID=506608 RepID=A0A5E4NIE8_9HEMI|nr:Hypothetical protein CINCED_3A019607 [Cinara cedri]